MESSATQKGKLTRLLVWFFVLSIAIACSKNQNLTQNELLSQFDLQQSEPAPGLGVLLVWRRNSYTYCNAFHRSPNEVVTNAHCVDPNLGLKNHHLVYRDVLGNRVVTEVESFQFVGDKTRNDVAVLKADVSDWEVLPLVKVDGDKSRARVLSYDPVPSSQVLSMALNPKQCSFSTQIPPLYALEQDRWVNYFPKDAQIKLNANDQVFLQNCDQPLHGGNSGSAITMIDQSLAILHWQVDSDPFHNLYFFQGKVWNIPQTQRHPFYWVGTRLQ